MIIPIQKNLPKYLGLWTYHFFFFSVIALLAWPSFSVWSRIFLFPGGLLLLTSIAWKRNHPNSAENDPLFLQEFLNPPHRLGWMGILAAALVFRFYHLVGLQRWPLWDDADLSYYAIGLSEKWRWHWSFGPQKLTPLFTWLQGLFFMVFPPSLKTMWLYPALLSLSVIPAAYLASRQYSSKSFSLLYTLLMGLSFTAVYWGRFCLGGSLLLFWQLVLLGTLGWALKAPPRVIRYRAFVLGLGLAIGFYLSFLLLITCFLVSLVFGGFCFPKRREGVKILLFYLMGFLVPALPMVLWVFPGIIQGHLAAHLIGAEGPFSWLHQFATSFSYPTAFFFGTIDQSYWNFGPLWGGFLNPLLGAGFFLGLMEFRNPFKKGFEKTIVLGLLLSLGPFLLGSMVECMRSIQILPFLIWIVTLGMASLIQNLKNRHRWPVLILFLFLSMVLDSWHLFGVFHQWSLTKAMTPGLAIKSPERYKAFQILEREAQQQGPGLIFSDFVSDIYDQSLLVSTYPFNALRNPRLSVSQASWAAVLCELHYQAPLRQRFPHARFFLLSDSSAGASPVFTLALFPVGSAGNFKNLTDWINLHRKLQDLYGEMPFHVKNPDFTPVIGQLLSLYPKVEKDPLLKAWVLEKTLDLLLVASDVTPSLWFLHQPQTPKSFPFLNGKFALVYHRLGLGLLKNGDREGARECFRRASKFDPKYDAKKFLSLCR